MARALRGAGWVLDAALLGDASVCAASARVLLRDAPDRGASYAYLSYRHPLHLDIPDGG